MYIEIIVDLLSWILMIGGLSFIFLGLLGVYKMKDIYMKQHSAGLIDTFGLFLVCLSLSIQSGFSLVSVKPILLSILVALMSAPSCYAFMQILIRRDQIIHKNNDEHIDLDSLNKKITNGEKLDG
jgi:monovalent cation/proton antiporter MnhG/PhaG subunit